ncbi:MULTISPECIES: cyclase family protein [Bradyrhizobium]|uniref:cyclase family protein n=1 Tax=Bradyrhizobium centrosematis TaxID=1300039 RepID=UPI002166C774|nr:cyclase family protein [Bradyrhizobium centrosematis]MCS3765876.1 kynurenine formamidase [Bradyrhizobium centrosematis]MCS3778222.1 kynurenine formamidase [Bradyrhizobium centrosematis]
MEIIDLSRELFHRTATHPAHPPFIVSVWDDHDTKWIEGSSVGSSKAVSISCSDHAGTHVDAPVHFDSRPGALSIDQVPLEKFYTEAICLDLSHVPLEHAVTIPEMEDALRRSGQEIKPEDTVLLYMATNDRLYGSKGYLFDFPGLAPESVHWLADRGIGMFGVEAISPAPTGELNLIAHNICAERGITHIECLFNLDKVVGRGRFRFAGFPLKIRGGTASPIRAVAIFE